MSSNIIHDVTTADQLLRLPHGGHRCELVKGVIRMMSPAGSEHGRTASRILLRLASHVERHGLGETYAAETGFQIAESPDTVRAPDAAFVSHRQLASVGATQGYLPLAPDLVVEVISPHDSFSAVEAKARDWLDAGSQIVLVADPMNQMLRAYRTGGQVELFRPGDTFFAGEEICGNWQLSVNDVFQIDNA